MAISETGSEQSLQYSYEISPNLLAELSATEPNMAREAITGRINAQALELLEQHKEGLR